ncbi:transcriptional regulator [Aneurinibacillus migulanus]|uniref:Transcriptional regulator n=1 Tax=Aneurinibacillus migulanus TaxID=47500 RepID=A0A0D1XSB8_ANEMI|nr:GntR family transcriptional regulator [Aneurinibacillus migulanus]KIV50809.1 transcriptional regulator [Aneurinibacillus migulanus]KIV57151.1 transcriptional regulator [Aneurinibacillus migulanus]KON97089.1 transcriptional regulator [Aneurinibacillus migulanus]KPD07586.1 transcriptional regulator [Aneurinibacillus migulanus]MED0896361.1 GntR family transcriptional regulator [Aneurinibacillus migulanus]
MGEEFNASQPIYQQIVARICRQIVREEIKPGEKLPSVREMAVQSGVNPNTVQRVYSELERMNIVEARRGQGSFVTENLEELERLRVQLKVEYIGEFVRNMKEMGFSPSEIIEGIQDYLKQEE